MAITVRIVDNSNAFMQRTMAQVGMGVAAAAEVLSQAMKDTLSRRGTSGGGYHSGRGGNLPSSPGSPPSYQRGELHRSIRATPVVVSGSRASSSVGTNRRYGASLEHGFTATAKGGALTIPVQREAYNLLERYGRVRNIPGLVPIRKRDGRTLLCLKGPNGSLKPMFLLQKRIVVAARPWLKPSLDRARPAMAAAFVRAASVGRNAA
jgi:hypothetical protein